MQKARHRHPVAQMRCAGAVFLGVVFLRLHERYGIKPAQDRAARFFNQPDEMHRGGCRINPDAFVLGGHLFNRCGQSVRLDHLGQQRECCADLGGEFLGGECQQGLAVGRDQSPPVGQRCVGDILAAYIENPCEIMRIGDEQSIGFFSAELVLNSFEFIGARLARKS